MQANPFPDVAPWILSVGLVLVAVVAWLVGSSLSALGSGWHKLEHRFRAKAPFSGDTINLQTGYMRWGSRYFHTLTLGANADGLYIAAMLLARVAHPPLFIPWNQISAIDQSRRFREGTLLTLGQKEQVPLWVFKSTGDWLQAYMPSTEEKMEKFYSEHPDDSQNG